MKFVESAVLFVKTDKHSPAGSGAGAAVCLLVPFPLITGSSKTITYERLTPDDVTYTDRLSLFFNRFPFFVYDG